MEANSASGTSATELPRGLVEWSGHRSGGVRKPFFNASGRPCGVVIETPLLLRVREWATQLVTNPAAPRILLLVGGPGNGKTEAVEDVLRYLDNALARNGTLATEFAKCFSGDGGRSVPRMVSAHLGSSAAVTELRDILVVQDASVTDAGHPGVSPAELLVRDLGNLIGTRLGDVYIACVNRGVLDDALTIAADSGRAPQQHLLEAVIRSVGQSPSAPACWPLGGFPDVVVWPMDVESLVWATKEDTESLSPAEQLLLHATDATKWPAADACAAGEYCPFCRSRMNLEKPAQRQSLLRILRWNELATGKRWSFRDLFSLVSYLLAGGYRQDSGEVIDPCVWAARMHELSKRQPGTRNESARLRAPFVLVGAQYEHALFCAWPRLSARGLRSDIKDLEMLDDPGLMGLHFFLSAPREVSIPATLQPQLAALSDALDPAMADPTSKLKLSSREMNLGREIDARFSQSVGEGLGHTRRLLSTLEVELLERLKATDERLSSAAVRRRRPAVARRMQSLVRDFSCRLVRRSLGVRHGLARERELLSDFEMVVGGNTQLLLKAAKQVEALINDDEHFLVYLNSTFGEPLAPAVRRATLHTAKQKVRPIEDSSGNRPAPTVRFLSIGSKVHPLALTYELFRSVRELEAGMLPASLPRAVVALLDATRARLGGGVVRNEEILDGAEIRIGTRDIVISRELGEFVVLKEDPE